MNIESPLPNIGRWQKDNKRRRGQWRESPFFAKQRTTQKVVHKNIKWNTYMLETQLELFDKTENEILKEEIIKIKESSDKVRRRLFASLYEMGKQYLDILQRLEKVESTYQIPSQPIIEAKWSIKEEELQKSA